MFAQETSQHQISITTHTISLQILAYPATATACHNAQYAARSKGVANWDPAMPLLGHRLQEFLLDNRLSHNRTAYNRADLQPLPFDRIRVHKHAVLAADCPWDPDDLLLQTVRANNSFHGKPFFDFVTVKVAVTPASSRVQRTTEEFAQLLLLFSLPVGELDNHGRRKFVPHAYVKWFKKAPLNRVAADPLVKAGVVLLLEDRGYDPAKRQLSRHRQQQGGSAAAAATVADSKNSNGAGGNGRAQLCGVIPLSAIIRREYVMKDYARPGGWIKNPFKY